MQFFDAGHDALMAMDRIRFGEQIDLNSERLPELWLLIAAHRNASAATENANA